jgi:multidrug efflux pump subunit AcrA (membrane-fusion protein)
MRRGYSTTVFISVGAIVVVSAIWFLFNLVGSNSNGEILEGELFSVSYGGFDISVPTSGELAAQNQINIHNKLESNAVVIELVDEGSIVEKDDVLLKLNDETIQNQIRDSEISVISAKNDLDTAKANLSIAEKKRESELSVKRLAVDLAGLSLMAWKDGEVVAKRLQLSLAIQTAKKDHDRLLKKYESSVRLYEQEFLSKDELDQDEIALLNSEATLKRAELDIEVYETYTYKKDLQKNESDLQQAKDELDRAKDRLASELNSLNAKIVATENNLVSREENLMKRKKQLEMCVFRSPASGMVVYATSLGDRRESDDPLKVGKSLWRNELVMTIPDTSKMIARVKVNEALSGLIKKGQVASIQCDAFQDESFAGEVLSVGVLAEGGGWRDPNRRDYTINIKLNNPNNIPLKPSMRCSADIFVERVDGVLFVPIHSIHRTGDVRWIWVQDGGGFSQRVVTFEKFSESFVSITSGVEEGDIVLLREPSPGQVIERLPSENGK